MASYDIEHSNLSAHVSICEQRYLALSDKLESTDQRLAKLETMVEEIHTALRKHQAGQNRQWLWLRDTAIVALVGVVAFLVNRLW